MFGSVQGLGAYYNPYISSYGNQGYATGNIDYSLMPLLENYKNQVAMLDPMNSPLSMNGSVFGAYPMINPYMGGVGVGNYYNNGKFDYDQYYADMRNNNHSMMENSLIQAQESRQYNYKANAPMTLLQKQATTLKVKIEQDEQDQIQQALYAYLASVRNVYDPNGQMSEQNLLAQAEAIYSQQFPGRSIQGDLAQYSKGSFKHGLLQALTFGMYDKTTAAENIATITGQPVGTRDSLWKKLGNAVGGSVLGALGLGLLGRMVKCGGKASILGAIGGAILGYLGSNGLSTDRRFKVEQ